jgi:RND family efflux transporter MFP subunit
MCEPRPTEAPVRPAGRRALAGGAALLLWAAAAAAADYPCLVEPYMVVDLSPAVEGVLASVDVRKGDAVAAGDAVARLESGIEEALVEQARARMDMHSAIMAREVSLARNIEKHERAVKLSSQKFVSPDELEELKSAVDLARLELETERDNQRLAEIELKRTEAQLEQRVIRSPVDGVVVQRYLNPGEFAQAQPIVRVAQLDPLNVEAVLPGEAYGTVVAGMPARVRLHGAGERVIDAVVTIVEQVIDAASGTFGVRVELPNPDLAIPAGLECTLEVGS